MSDWSQTLRTAEKHLSRGKITAAIEEYRNLVNSNPSDLTVLNTLGDLYIRAGFTEQATPIFSRVAQGYRHQGFTSKAIAILKKLLRVDPTDLDSSICLAECYAAQGLRGEAGRLYGQVADAYKRAGREDKAMDAFQRMAEIDPSNTSMLMTLGERWLREGSKQRAHASFAAAGEELYRQGNAAQALLAYLKAQDAQPDDHKTLSAITSICVAHSQADNAFAILRDAHSRNPGDAVVLSILGSAYLSAGQLSDATETFRQLFVLDGTEYRNLFIVGQRFMEQGDLDRAVEQIDCLVDALIASRNEQKAIDFLKKALDLDPEHPASLRILARIYRRLHEDFNLVLTLRAIADGALRRGDSEEAVAALEELCCVEPYEQSHKDALERLGVNAPTTTFAVCLTNDSTFDLNSSIPDEPNALELHLALKQVYVYSLPDPASNIFQADGIGQTSRPLPDTAHEFVTADVVRGVTFSPHRSASKATDSAGAVTGFELLPLANRRRAARISARVPLVVISDSGGWREFTEAVDISDLGLNILLAHPVPPNTPLRVLIDAAKWPEQVARHHSRNTTKGIVRHCVHRPGNSNLVGVEFDVTHDAVLVERPVGAISIQI